LHTLIFTAITRLDENKATAHDRAAAYLINHLSINLLLKLHPKVLKHLGEQEPISQIMRSGCCCNPPDMVDHECWQVDLLSPVHQISEALVHSISLIAPLRMRNDVLDDEPEDQLMERLHIALLHCLWAFQPRLLAQVLGQLQQLSVIQQEIVLSDI